LYLIDAAGIWPDPSMVATIQVFPIPTTPINMRAFLGLTSYYRNFIKGYAHVARPLFKLTCKVVSFVWIKACQLTFEELKECLASVPILVRPDFTKLLILEVD